MRLHLLGRQLVEATPPKPEPGGVGPCGFCGKPSTEHVGPHLGLCPEHAREWRSGALHNDRPVQKPTVTHLPWDFDARGRRVD